MNFIRYYIKHYLADITLLVFAGFFLFFFVGIALQNDRTIFLRESNTVILIGEIVMTAAIVQWIFRRIMRKLKEENERHQRTT
jgi:membrane protein implicated in regulation of membrane protease activity